MIPDSWIVEEVISEDEDGTSAVIRISQNNAYPTTDQPTQKWPEMGQRLVKETEQ